MAKKKANLNYLRDSVSALSGGNLVNYFYGLQLSGSRRFLYGIVTYITTT